MRFESGSGISQSRCQVPKVASVTVLQGNLHDIEDPSAFVTAFLQRSGFKAPAPWTQDEFHGDLLSYTWELSLTYDKGDHPLNASNFSHYASERLRYEAVNWLRRKNGRTIWKFHDRVHIRNLPEFLPLDDRPESPDRSGVVDAGPDSESPLEWIVRARDSERVGRVDGMGEEPARVAA